MTAEADLRVHEPVQADRALGQERERSLLSDLSEGVEQAPRRLAGGEFRVPGRAPLVDDGWDLLGRGRSNVEAADHEIVRVLVGQLELLVALHPIAHARPAFGQLADGVSRELREVALDEGGMLAGDANLAGETEIIAHEDLRSDD